MSIAKIAVKFFAVDTVDDLEPVINTFHRWIQEKDAVAGMPIDVADYAHVPNGPGILLIGHEADHAVDMAEGPQGYLYNRKRGFDGARATPGAGPADLEQGDLEEIFRRAIDAAQLLEQAPELGGKLTIGTAKLRIVFNDRLGFPNDAATFEAAKPALEAVLGKIYGAVPTIEHDFDSKAHRLAVNVSFDGEKSLADLRAAL